MLKIFSSSQIQTTYQIYFHDFHFWRLLLRLLLLAADVMVGITVVGGVTRVVLVSAGVVVITVVSFTGIQSLGMGMGTFVDGCFIRRCCNLCGGCGYWLTCE